MLRFEQIKAIEHAPGEEKAGPILQAFETVEEHFKAELVTREHFDFKMAELKAGFEGKLNELESSIEIRFKELEAEIAETKSEAIRWVAGLLLAQAALVATLIKLL